MNKYDKAVKLATEAHEGQVRKVSGLPYVTHPIQVSILIKEKLYGKLDEETLETLMVSAVLHDILEDTNITFDKLVDEFGMQVAMIVNNVTKKEGSNYFDFLTNIYENDNAVNSKIVKYFDMQHNLQDSDGAVSKPKADLYRTWSYFLKEQVKFKYDIFL